MAMTMRYILAIVGLCAPLSALAQEVDGSPVAHAIGDVDSFLHQIQTTSVPAMTISSAMSPATSVTLASNTISPATTVTLGQGEQNPTTTGAASWTVTSGTSLPTAGLIPIPLIRHGPASTSSISANSSGGVSSESLVTSVSTGMLLTTIVVPGSGVLTVSKHIPLSETATMAAQPTSVPDSMKNETWRFDATAPCKAGGKYAGNKTDCKIKRCLWEHSKPLDITSVWPAIEFPIEWTNASLSSGNNASVEYTLGRGEYTEHWISEQRQLVSQLHYGTTKPGTYYPHQTLISHVVVPATTIIYRSRTSVLPAHTDLQTSLARVWPHGKPVKDAEPVPNCSNDEECLQHCKRDAIKRHKRTMRNVAIGAGIGAAALALLVLCCLLCCFRRKRRDTSDRDRNESTGQSVAPRASSTGNAVTAVPVVAQAANTGTLGRQAEEGRSRVHFPEHETGEGTVEKPAEAPKQTVVTPVTSGGSEQVADGSKKAVVVSEKPAEQHVEAIPAHDGADSRPTGSERFDMASMRGRRTARGELKNVF